MRSTNAHSLHRHRPPSDDIQPTAILGAIGMIATLMLMWVGIAAAFRAEVGRLDGFGCAQPTLR